MGSQLPSSPVTPISSFPIPWCEIEIMSSKNVCYYFESFPWRWTFFHLKKEIRNDRPKSLLNVFHLFRYIYYKFLLRRIKSFRFYLNCGVPKNHRRKTDVNRPGPWNCPGSSPFRFTACVTRFYLLSFSGDAVKGALYQVQGSSTLQTDEYSLGDLFYLFSYFSCGNTHCEYFLRKSADCYWYRSLFLDSAHCWEPSYPLSYPGEPLHLPPVNLLQVPLPEYLFRSSQSPLRAHKLVSGAQKGLQTQKWLGDYINTPASCGTIKGKFQQLTPESKKLYLFLSFPPLGGSARAFNPLRTGWRRRSGGGGGGTHMYMWILVRSGNFTLADGNSFRK